MTSSVIYNNFKSPKFWRSRFRRSEYELWDANIHHGDVRPFACPVQMCEYTFSYLHSLPECECLGFVDRTPVCRGFCQDQHFLIVNGILRHQTVSEMCSFTPASEYAGAPVPPSVIPPLVDNCTGCDAVGVTYVTTYVVEHAGIQIESAPSEPVTMVVSQGDIPNVILNLQPVSSFHSNYGIIARRVYRTEATYEDGTDSMAPHGAEFVLVAELDPTTLSFGDVVATADTRGPLTTYEPMAFPAPYSGGPLIALARTLDGIVVAERNRVYISIPGQPQFTFDGVVDIEDNIQEIVAINNTIFVFTDNKPVKIGYRHTDGVMSIDKQVIERRLPLKSLQSVSVYGSKVYFASTHSLYVWDIGGYGSDIGSALTPLLTPEQWVNIDVESVKGVAYEFGYILAADNLDYSLMIEFGGDRTDLTGGATIIPISYINNVNGFGLDYDGHILYTSSTQGYMRWDWRRKVLTPLEIHDNVLPAIRDLCECCPWMIKMYFDNEGKNRFSKMRVEWDERSASDLTVNFYYFAFGKEELIAGPLSIISSRGFSIPKYCSSQTFCVEVSGCGIMHEIRMATSNQELVSNSNKLIGNSDEQP